MVDHESIENRLLEGELNPGEIAKVEGVSRKAVDNVRKRLSPWYSQQFDQTLNFLQKECVRMVAIWKRFLPKPTGPEGSELTEGEMAAGALSLKSLAELRKVLMLVLSVLDKVSNMQHSKEFQDIVITEVAKESPECAKRIMGRLRTFKQVERVVK